ncbi:SpoIVB peptidase S55 domain-containing protein [Nocardioides sp. GCM10027113]|uniref:SpoIVB peptidase S55 domain-containing protein n=1 Tax=unclassified Nocardioides TaxID=2615069 RepID=UPI003623D7C9
MTKRVRMGARRRVSVAVALSVTAAGGVSATLVGPAVSAGPAEDCAVPFPVAEVARDQVVHGLTVERGTTPEPFSGTVLGVLEDGIAPDLDMIMAELDSPAIQKAGGIWQGMSGSPVYAEDGRLLGAVAYGLSWGPSPIAGITPFEEMDDYLTPKAAPVRVEVDDRTARMLARRTGVSVRAAGEFRQLRIPLRVSGVRAERLAQARKQREDHRWVMRRVAASGAPASPGSGPGPDTIVAGGNLAVALSYGDITLGGVGTATSVCRGEVVGFGHPATFLGDTTLTLHPADALFVQPESLGAPFKVANPGAPVGTITDDRLAGVTGTFGALPRATTVTSDLTFVGKGRQRSGSSEVSTPQALAFVTFIQQLVNHDRVLDGITQGSELMSWQITGESRGTPFALAMTDRFASRDDIAFEVPWEVADLVWVLSRIPGITLDDVTIGAEVVDDPSKWRVVGVQQRRRGAWVDLDRSSPAVSRPGGVLRLRAVLHDRANDVTTTVRVSVDVPQRRAFEAVLEVAGGGSVFSSIWGARTLEAVERRLARAVRNDAVQASLTTFFGRRPKVSREVSEPTEKVVNGRKRVPVVLR